MVLNSKFNIPNARELFKSLKNAKSEWKLKTPMQKWCYFYGIGKYVYRVLRLPIFNDVNHVHWFAYFLIVNGAVIILLSLYTICYYSYHGATQMALPSTCVAFIFMGVSIHYSTIGLHIYYSKKSYTQSYFSIFR